MEKMNFYDTLSIIPNSDNTNYFNSLEKELTDEYRLNLSLLNNTDFDKIASNPFHFVHFLLSYYNYPVQNYNIFYDLKFHCYVSALYTCSFLTSTKSERLTKIMASLTTLTNKSADARDPANVIRRFDKLNNTNFSTLINSSIIYRKSSRIIHSQIFLPKLFYSFDIVLSNKPYITLNNHSDNKSTFSQYFKNAIDELISDYSDLLNLCLPKNLILDTLFYYYLSNIFYNNLLIKNSGINPPVTYLSQFLNLYVPKDAVEDTYYRHLLMQNTNIKKPISNLSQISSLLHTDEIIESMLYYYKLENTFHTNLLMKNIGKLSNTNFNIEKLNLLTKLPNVFSRNSWGHLIDNNDHIEYLGNFLVPLYQKVFFFILYHCIERENLDFNKKIEAIKMQLISSLKPNLNYLCSFFIDELNILTYSPIKLHDKNCEFTYDYHIAKDISNTLKMLYVNEININYTFPNFSSEKLITYIYNFKKMIPKTNLTIEESYLKCKMFEYSEPSIFPEEYNNFLILKKTLILANYEFSFPTSTNTNLDILFAYLSDLAYCCVLIKYTVNYSLDFIKRFIPLFNVSFNVISEVNDYSWLFHTNFEIREIKFSTFSSDEMINALKIMRDASCYFSEVIFEFDELTMLSVDLSDNNEFSKLKSHQTELCDLIISIEQELNNLPLS